MAKLTRRLKRLALIAGITYAVLHHLFHLYVQPALNNIDFFQNLPPFFLGSTTAVTIFIFLLTWLGARNYIIREV